MSNKKRLLAKMKEDKIIAISRGVAPVSIVKTAEALYAGGIHFLEITFNQTNIAETEESLKYVIKHMSDRLCVGAGTVLSPEQVRIAHGLGAGYIVTPNTDTRVIEEAVKLDMAVVAGAMTPSEIVTAYNAGADYVKVFPAGVFGLDYIKAVRGPLSHIPLFAVGGIDHKNIKQAFETGIQGVGLGSNLVRNDYIEQGNFEGITEIARKYREIVSSLS